jgi:hypothetical protein
VDLTFATHLAADSRSECQIQNSTSNLYLLVTSGEPNKLLRGTWTANVQTGRLVEAHVLILRCENLSSSVKGNSTRLDPHPSFRSVVEFHNGFKSGTTRKPDAAVSSGVIRLSE